MESPRTPKSYFLATSVIRGLHVGLPQVKKTKAQEIIISNRRNKEVSIMGGDLEGPGGTDPQNLRWGDGPCIRSPNFEKYSVNRCVAKYELNKRRCGWRIFF